MTAAEFLERFGHFVDAPDGVQRMREMVLQLAVQGKLTDQLPSDGTASDLLDEIETEKTRLIESKEIRRSKPPLFPDNPPQHDVPSSWVWTRLYEIGEIGPRNTAADDADSSFVPMESVSDIYGVPVRHEVRQWKDIKTGFTHFREGDVVLAKITPCFQNGKSTVMRALTNGFGAGTTELHVFRPIAGSIDPDYVLIYLKSPGFISNGIPTMTGTAGQKRITRDYFAGNHFPLPPLAEQHRIVAKVDELMALCDRLEAERNARNETHTRLIRAVHHPLTEASDAASTATAWRRIRHNFAGLYTTRESVQALRQTILQLAVQGKLVPQDSNEEPAAMLLKRISVEKQRIIKDCEFRNAKMLGDVEKTSQPFPPPEGWHWVRLGNITTRIGSGSTPRGGRNAYVDTGVLFLRSQNIWNSDLKVEDAVFIPEETHQRMKSTSVLSGDILLNITGASLGRSTIVPDGLGPANVSQHVTIIRPVQRETTRFLHLTILSPLVQSFIWGRQVGMAREGLSKKVLEQFEFPIPPLPEQHRIVAKVDQLMALCDQLEAAITSRDETARRYAEAVVQQLSAA